MKGENTNEAEGKHMNPWTVPNFVIGKMPTGRRQDGFNPDAAPKWALASESARHMACGGSLFSGRSASDLPRSKSLTRPTTGAAFRQPLRVADKLPPLVGTFRVTKSRDWRTP